MTEAAQQDRTVPAFPLGRPADRDRYSMTPAQAELYRWLVEQRPHHTPFQMHFRDAARDLGGGSGSIHYLMRELVDRGWVSSTGGGAHAQYQMVPPVMRFGPPREMEAAS
jgi:DNA-binding MarR family transcriptional regulator